MRDVQGRSSLLLAASVAAQALTACLPGDTRPEPGSVLTTVSGSAATREGFSSADATPWSVSFERVLLGAGPMQLGDECQKYAEYAEPGYDRVLELTEPPGQKLGIMYGLGRCDIDFQLSPPSDDAVLGSGVSEEDKAFMRMPGSDPYVANAGIVLHVEGSATQGARTVRFAWDIRQSLFFVNCNATVDGVFEPGLDLQGGVALTYDLLIEVEGLFRDGRDREMAVLRFDPFANADAVHGDADGIVTLAELGAVPLDEARASGGAYDGFGVETLADYVYRTLWPTLLRYRGTGSCNVSLEED